VGLPNDCEGKMDVVLLLSLCEMHGEMYRWYKAIYRLQAAAADSGGLVLLVPLQLEGVAGAVGGLLGHGAVLHAGTGSSHEGNGGGGAALEGVGQGGDEEGAGGVNIVVHGEQLLAGSLLSEIIRGGER